MIRFIYVLCCVLSLVLFSCSETSPEAQPEKTYQLFLEELSHNDVDSLKTFFQDDLSHRRDSIFVFHSKNNDYDYGNLVLEVRDSTLRAEAIQLNDSIFGKGISTPNNKYIVWRGDNISQPRLEISWEPHPTLEHIMVFTKREKL